MKKTVGWIRSCIDGLPDEAEFTVDTDGNHISIGFGYPDHRGCQFSFSGLKHGRRSTLTVQFGSDEESPECDGTALSDGSALAQSLEDLKTLG